MWNRIFAAVLVSAASVAASAPAMTAPRSSPCRVVNGEKLPADSGGPAAICAAIERATATKAPRVRYSAEVRVLSRSALAVKLEVAGRELAEQHFAVMDRNINPGFITRTAEALAETIAQAAGKA